MEVKYNCDAAGRGWEWWDVESTRGHCNVFSGIVKIHLRELNRKLKDPRLVTIRTNQCDTCLDQIQFIQQIT